MSYEKVQNISIKKDKTITMTSVSSNESPARYHTYEIHDGDSSTFTEKLRKIFNDRIGGSLKFNNSSTSRVFYAYLKTEQHYFETYEESIVALWVSEDDEDPVFTVEEAKVIMNQLFAQFLHHLSMSYNINMSKKKYSVCLTNGYYLCNSLNDVYSHSRVPRRYTINSALVLQNRYGGEVLDIEKS